MHSANACPLTTLLKLQSRSTPGGGWVIDTEHVLPGDRPDIIQVNVAQDDFQGESWMLPECVLEQELINGRPNWLLTTHGREVFRNFGRLETVSFGLTLTP